MFRWFLATLAATVSITAASAAFVVTVVPSSGPVVNSPSFSGYGANAAQGLHNGTSFGAAGPTSYKPTGTYTPGALINSITAPGNGVNDLFNGLINQNPGQLGNSLYSGLALRSTVAGQTFNLNDITFSFNYPNNADSGSSNLGATTNGYNSQYLLGASTIGGPLTPVTGPTQALQELYYVGSSYTLQNAPGAGGTSTNPYQFNGPAQLQSYFNDPFTPRGFFTGTYTVTNAFGTGTGSGTTEINGVPAPATLGLLGIGLAGIVARVRRKVA
jgi:hypothetical protein